MKRKEKQNRVSIEEYIDTYCREKRIRGRFAVYVSKDVHDKLRNICGLFKTEYYTTTSSLADSIISHHFEAHRELLNQELKEDAHRFVEGIAEMRKRRIAEMGDDTEEYEYDVYSEDDSPNTESLQDDDSDNSAISPSDGGIV